MVSFGYDYGNVYAHTSKVNYLSNLPVKGFSVNVDLNTREFKNWEKYFNFPDYGISYNYKDFSKTLYFGNSHSLTAYMKFSFLPKRWFLESGIVGHSGVGYFENYSINATNPEHTAIGSKLNMNAQGRLYIKVKVHPVYFEYSYGLNHFSNGLIKAPNLGVNVMNNSFSIGISSPQKNRYLAGDTLKKEYFVKDEIWTTASVGFKQLNWSDKTFFFRSATLNYSKQITKINKLGIGIDYSYDESATEYASKMYDFHGQTNLNERFGLNAQLELVLGNFNFFTAYGFYFGDDKYYPSKKYYKVGYKQYFGNVMGFVLIRAIPLFRAEVVEFGIGYSIKRKKEYK